MIVSLFLALTPAPADVIVVDPSGGGDFTDIQPAIDAAADGDVILVRGGTYSSPEITGKALTLVADGPVTVVGGMRVQHTLVQHDVVLNGIELVGEHLATLPAVAALTIFDARGAVRVEDCTFQGADGPVDCDDTPHGDCAGGPAVVVERALDVSFTRCSLTGGEGKEWTQGEAHNAGGDALVVLGASIAMHDCALQGGDGWTSRHTGLYLDEGGNGGDGVHAVDGPVLPATVYLASVTATGGVGGDGEWCLCQGGDGGDGVHLVGPNARVLSLDNLFSGSPEGCGGLPSAPGVPLRLEAGASSVPFVGRARSLVGPKPGTTGTVRYLGLPGDPAVSVRFR